MMNDYWFDSATIQTSGILFFTELCNGTFNIFYTYESHEINKALSKNKSFRQTKSFYCVVINISNIHTDNERYLIVDLILS